MALSSTVRALMSRRAGTSQVLGSSIALPAIWAGFLTLLIAGPWLGPGYIFGTDWPGPRRFEFPTDLPSWAPLQAALAVVSRVATGELTGKVFVLGLLFAAVLLAFRAAPVDGFVPRAAASAVFVFNPFVFGRLHYGQMFVLAGYALVPWVLIRLRKLLLEPGVRAALLLGISLTVVGITSNHMFLIAVTVVGTLLLTHALVAGKPLQFVRRVGPSMLLAVGAMLVASSYWVIPLLLGRGPIAERVSGFTTADLTAYAAVPDPQLGLLPNLLGLYGFWAETTGRFASMKLFVPAWPAVLAALLVLAAIGAVWGFRQREGQLRAWVLGLVVAAAVALVLEMGVSSSITRSLVTWLDATFPVYRGMRDAGKWAALLALVYSQLTALGAAAVLGWVRSHLQAGDRNEWLGAAATGLLLALPIYYGNGLLFGMHGEIKPSSYPPGWYQADRVLAADGHAGRALFLPWHEYMGYSFIQNQNKVVAAPGPTFFSIPVLVSLNPEVAGVAPPADPDQVAITSLVQSGGQGHWSAVLTDLHIRYILVAREVDWESFRYLVDQPGLVKIGDYGSIVLYRNNGP